MPWYDRKLNPIDNPSINETCVFIQKPHARTVTFFNDRKIIRKRVEFPWTAFICCNLDAYFLIFDEMPTLDSKLRKIKSPLDICGFVCLEHFHEHYNENTPQNCLDYFWSSAFESDSKSQIDNFNPMDNKRSTFNLKDYLDI